MVPIKRLLWSLLVFVQLVTLPAWLCPPFLNSFQALEMVNHLAELVKGSHGVDNHTNCPVVWSRQLILHCTDHSLSEDGDEEKSKIIQR